MVFWSAVRQAAIARFASRDSRRRLSPHFLASLVPSFLGFNWSPRFFGFTCIVPFEPLDCSAYSKSPKSPVIA